MLYNIQNSYQSYVYDNWSDAPGQSQGTTVIPGASNAEGSWTRTADAANVSSDIYGIYVQINGALRSARAKLQVMDIGVDPAGGTAYQPIISNLVCGESPQSTNPGLKEHYFPYFVKANSSIAVRFSGSNAGPDTVFTAMTLYGNPSNQSMMPVGSYSEAYGISNTHGTVFVPGNNVDGAWVLLGTTSRPIWWWQLGYQINNTTITAEYTYITLAVGTASYKKPIFTVMHAGSTSESVGLIGQTQMLWHAAYRPVPAGTNVYVMGRCTGAPDTGYQAGVIGIGG
jgi:hypothetical protein